MKEHSNEQFLPSLQLEFKTYPCFVGMLLGSLLSQPAMSNLKNVFCRTCIITNNEYIIKGTLVHVLSLTINVFDKVNVRNNCLKLRRL